MKDYKKVEFTNLDDEKIAVTFKLLKRRHAGKILNKGLQAVMQAVGGLGLSEKDSRNLVSAIDALDFDTVIWPLAQALLTGAAISLNPAEPADIIVIESLDETDFFNGRWDDLYLFIWHGFNANYPKELARVRTRLEKMGLDLSKAKEALTKQVGDLGL